MTYLTHDLQTASFIYSKGVDFIAIKTSPDNPNIKDFEFPEGTEKLVELYKNGAEANAIKLFDAYHKLRWMIMPPKNRGGGF